MTPAVFDCVVFLQAAANPAGAAGACLTFVESGAVQLFLSPPILQETRDVLTRPTTRKRFPQLTEEKVDRFLLKLAALSTVMHEVPVTLRLPRDPADEPYVNLALAAQAAFVVTRDNDMLALMQDDQFKSSYPQLTVIDPPAFLKHVRVAVARELGYE